jgi:hypothetical protein
VTHSKVLDVVQNLVIKSEIIAGNDVDASLLLKLPMCETKTLGLLQEIFLGDL